MAHLRNDFKVNAFSTALQMILNGFIRLKSVSNDLNDFSLIIESLKTL